MSKVNLTIFNKTKNTVLLYLIPIIMVIFCLAYHSAQENKMNQAYYDNLYFDKKIKEHNDQITIKGMEENESLSDDKKDREIKKDELSSNINLEIFQSYNSLTNQNYFLTKEIEGISGIDFDEMEDIYLPIQRNKISKYITGKTKVNRYLIKHNLPLKSVKYSTDSAIFIINIMTYLSTPWFFAVVFLIYFMCLFQKYETNQIKFLITQPISRREILMADSKYFFKKLSFLLIYILGISFISSFILSHSLSINYPILVTILGDMKLIPVWGYFIILVISFYLIGFFLFLLTYLIVIFSKKVVFSIIICLLVVVFLNGVVQAFPTQIINSLNPFSYVQAKEVFVGENSENDVDAYDSLINVDGEKVNIVTLFENVKYYANDSLSSRSGYIEPLLLPIILLIFIILFSVFVQIYLNRYKI